MTKALTPEQWAAKREKSLQNDIERRKAYYQANKERIKARSKARYESGKADEYLREYRNRSDVKARRRMKAAEKVFKASPEERAANAIYRRAWVTGVPADVFHDMKISQDDKCGVCKNPLDEGRIHTDHCHETGAIRGLLCQGCNTTEGRIRKLGLTPLEFAERLHDYLTNPPASKYNLFWPDRKKR